MVANESGNTHRKLIKINTDAGHGIKLEKFSEFKESYFSDVYYDAFGMTRKIIEQNPAIKKGSSQERLYNIITFCGERGTGKSSVMYSFVEALRCGKKESYREFFQSKGDKGSQSVFEENDFLCLEEIDASLLEEKEDIFDVILAKMFQTFRKSAGRHNKNCLWMTEREENNGYSNEAVIREFEKIYRGKYYLQRGEHKYDESESPVEVLNNLAGSLRLRELLVNFVPLYLKTIFDSQGISASEKKYLVISIDDLDMNTEGYRMLEQLHRYFMIPGVIIYLAVSGKELQSACKKHFEKGG